MATTAATSAATPIERDDASLRRNVNVDVSDDGSVHEHVLLAALNASWHDFWYDATSVPQALKHDRYGPQQAHCLSKSAPAFVAHVVNVSTHLVTAAESLRDATSQRAAGPRRAGRRANQTA